MIKGWYKSGSELIAEMKETNLPDAMMAVWYLGQAGIVVKNGSLLYGIDLFLREGDFRNFAPPFTCEEAGIFDYLLCTHNHIDHLDDVMLKRLAVTHPETKIVVPAPFKELVEGFGFASDAVIGAETGKEYDLDEFRLRAVPAAHEEFAYDEKGRMECLGYVLYGKAGSLYHSGDTIEWESMVADLTPLQIDIMCLPINGSDWRRKHRDIIGNLDAREAADIAEQCCADLLIPTHFDLFPGNGENPAHLTDYMFYDHPGHKFHVMVPGERFIYMK